MHSLEQRLEFINSHKPQLPDGDYRLTIQQTLSIDGEADAVAAGVAEQYVYFSVAGPRFTLDPSLVKSVFPPAKTAGSYDNVLPHIVLNRSTLPWERLIKNDDETYSDVPWMALLVFNQNEVSQYGLSPQNSTVADLQEASSDPVFPGLTPEVGDVPSQGVQVIDVPFKLLQATVPPTTDLTLLTHVRELVDGTTRPTQDESNLFPILVANRIPTAGQEASVFLVSLENRTDIFDALSAGSEDPETKYRLISLHNWNFTVDPMGETFSNYIEQADTPKNSQNTDKSLRMDLLASSGSDAETANSFLAAGYVPLDHDTRQGNHTVSWYRGPFLPGAPPSTPGSFPLGGVLSPDQLVKYFSDVGMFDTSYAAAWQLGRLLTLQNTDVAVALYNWKRRRALAHQPTPPPGLPYTSVAQAPPLPENVVQWLNDLAQYRYIPFNYLVPKEEMLPVESLRFFQVDPVWRDCLLDGAFSVGRVLTSDAVLDQQDLSKVFAQLEQPQAVCGFLLRSAVVEGWPHMRVEGYSELPPADNIDEEGFATTVNIVRKDTLGTDIALYLFDQIVQTVDLHEVPETIHFGVTYNDTAQPVSADDPSSNSTTQWYKNYRSVVTAEEMEGVYADVAACWDSTNQTLRMGELAAALHAVGSAQVPEQAQGEDFSSNPWWVALQMIEGVQKVRLYVGTDGASSSTES